MINNYGYPSYNSMPSMAQPYGYPIMQPQIPTNPQNVSSNMPPQTNIIYVNGIEDVKNRPLPPNSNYSFMDNDNPILYRKTVDAQGKMTVEVFDIVPHKEKPVEHPDYALKSDILNLQKELAKLRMEVIKND